MEFGTAGTGEYKRRSGRSPESSGRYPGRNLYIRNVLPVRPDRCARRSEGEDEAPKAKYLSLIHIFALLAGTATTFSVATPLMATIISELFHVAVSRTVINIIILLITCAVYTYSLLHGFKGISKLANICIYTVSYTHL